MIRIGLIDGPLPKDYPELVRQARFCPDDGAPHAARHASAMADTIRFHCDSVALINAAVFPGQLSTSLQAVCDALDWMASDRPEIVLCSIGIFRPSTALLVKINALLQAGSLVVASAPARGGKVYPAAIDGVTSVQGDARCEPVDLSRLDLPTAEYGACPTAAGHPDIRGASPSAAHMTGHLARNWQGSAAETLGALALAIRFTGRERRTA